MYLREIKGDSGSRVIMELKVQVSFLMKIKVDLVLEKTVERRLSSVRT
jgi:hypothetical protein